MQAVTELVEQGACLVDVEQCRNVALRCSEVAYIYNHWAYVFTTDVALVYKVGHPGTLAFCVTWEEVGVENTQMITGSQLENALLDDIYLRSSYFSEVYRKALCLFKFDELMSYACPLEDYGIPFNAMTEDKLSIYSHLYHNTYRKELSEL